MKSWSFSIFLLILYVAVFLWWKYVPGRTSFVCGGLVAAGVATTGLVIAARRGYFVSRVDLVLHAYVIVDIFLEGVMYEAMRLFVSVAPAEPARISQFHSSNSYLFCALAFALLIGGYRLSQLSTFRCQASGIRSRR